MVTKVDNKTLINRAQSQRKNITYKPTAKNLANAVRRTPGVRSGVTYATIFNIPGDLMRTIDPQQQVSRSAAKKPNLSHVPKPVRNQAARRIQRGARRTINQGFANIVDNLLFLSMNTTGRTSPIFKRHHELVADYVRENPTPTNINMVAAHTIANFLLRGRGWPLGNSNKLRNDIARQIATYRPVPPSPLPSTPPRSMAN